MQDYLYRGISVRKFESDGMLIKSRVTGRVESSIKWGESICWSEGTWGESPDNTVLQHQKDSSRFKTPCISTTPHFEVAKSYALYADHNGLVFKINRKLLKENNIQEFIVNDIISHINLVMTR